MSDYRSLLANVNGQDFEKFVLTILDNETKRHGKELIVNSFSSDFFYFDDEKSKDLRAISHPFDAIAPNGIFDNMLTFIEIKKYNNLKSSIVPMIKQIELRYRHFYKNAILNNEEILNKRIKIIVVTSIPERTLETIDSTDYYNDHIEVWPVEKIMAIAQKSPIEFNAFIEFAISLEKSKETPKDLIDFAIESTEEEIEEQNVDLIKRLVRITRGRGLSLVLGTGVSMDFNDNLSWDELADRLYKELPTNKQFKDVKNSLKILGGETISKANYAKWHLKKTYTTIIYDLLYPHKGIYRIGDKSIDSCADLICQELPENRKIVKKVITYNYDDFLEQALKARSTNYNVLFRENDSLNGDFPIFHVHGYFPEGIRYEMKQLYGRNLVLTEEEYFECYNDSMNWRVAVQLETFKDDICLFVGNSITDFNEKRLIKKTQRRRIKPNFAIMHTKGLGPNDLIKIYSYFVYQLNISIIWAKECNAIPGIIKSIQTEILKDRNNSLNIRRHFDNNTI